MSGMIKSCPPLSDGGSVDAIDELVKRHLAGVNCIATSIDELTKRLQQLGRETDEGASGDMLLREAIRQAAIQRLIGFDGAERLLDIALRLRSPETLASDDLPDNVDPFSDLANAYRVVRVHGKDLRHGPAHGWMCWNGRVWRPDDREPVRRAMDVAQRLRTYACTLIERAKDRVARERADQYLSHARRSQQEPALRKALALAQRLLPIACAPDAWDRDEWLFSCANGTLDLRTGELHIHCRADMITRCSPVAFNAHATAPTWERMLERVQPSLEMREFIQRYAGYSMTGTTREQCMAIFWGGGLNGKSTVLEALRYVFGDYACNCPTESLMVSSGGQRASNDIARLRGARIVTAVETEAQRQLSEALIKQLTGGDTVTARLLYREFFEFRPQFKLILALNDRPVIKATDYGMWRRLRLVPFTVQITKSELDLGLADKLRAEAEGILAWVVRGCIEWQRLGGLREPEAVVDATEAWRTESNHIVEYIGERCVVAEHASVMSSNIYADYRAWSSERGHPPFDMTQFRTRLERLGHSSAHTRRGTCWRGIGLRANDSVTGDER